MGEFAGKNYIKVDLAGEGEDRHLIFEPTLKEEPPVLAIAGETAATEESKNS